MVTTLKGFIDWVNEEESANNPIKTAFLSPSEWHSIRAELLREGVTVVPPVSGYVGTLFGVALYVEGDSFIELAQEIEDGG